MSRTLSPVRFESKSSEIAPISCNFESNPDGFLYTSDCVAEREGFELSVQLVASKGADVSQLSSRKVTQTLLVGDFPFRCVQH
jgi:hypothetical protein